MSGSRTWYSESNMKVGCFGLSNKKVKKRLIFLKMFKSYFYVDNHVCKCWAQYKSLENLSVFTLHMLIYMNILYI